jgi:hypothetical protein
MSDFHLVWDSTPTGRGHAVWAVDLTPKGHGINKPSSEPALNEGFMRIAAITMRNYGNLDRKAQSWVKFMVSGGI